MKKFITFIAAFIFISLSAFSQVRKPIFIVPDSTTAFGVSMPASSLIFDTESDRLWTITAFARDTDRVETVTKKLIVEGGAASDLEAVLTAGNTPGANDILMKLRAVQFGSTDLVSMSEDGAGEFILLNNSGATSALNFQNQNGTTLGTFGLGLVQGIFEQTGLLDAGKIKLNFGVIDPSIILESDNASGGFHNEIVSTTPTADRTTTLQDLSGTVGLTSQYLENADITIAADRTVTMGANDFTFTRTTGNFGINIASPTQILDIGLAATNGIVSFFSDRTGGSGAILADNQNLNFYYNDDIGTRTLGSNNITSRVSVAPTTGDVQTDLIFGSHMKVLATGNTLFHPSATTQPASAFVHMKQDGTGNNISLLVDGNGNTGSQSIVFFRNLAQNSLMRIDGAGKTIFNDAGLNLADFQIESDLLPFIFYVDASVNSIGIGTSTPSIKTILQLESSTRGFRLPSMTSTERDAITSPINGLEVYDETNDDLNYYNGAAWRRLVNVAAATLDSGGVAFADVNGSSLATDTANFFWDHTNYRLGITNTAPAYPLDVTGDINSTGVFRSSGAAGLSATYDFGGGSGNIATMTFTGGILTGITTVP